MPEPESRLATVEPTEKGLRALDRIKERFRVADLPPAFHVLAGSETGASDIAANLDRQLADGKLPEKTKLIVAVAVASAAGGRAATDFFTASALAAGRTRAEVLDAIAAAAVCAIFNGYYRFRHQLPADLRPTYDAFRAPFNANTHINSALTHTETETICLAVSSLNNCEACVASHLAKAHKLGLTDEQIDEAIKAGAVAAAVAKLLSALGGC